MTGLNMPAGDPGGNPTTRRGLVALFGLAAAATAVPAVAAAQQPQLNEAQRRLALWAYEFKGELALAVAQHVIDAGFGYDDVEGICLTGIRKGETRRVTIYVTDGVRTWSFDERGRRSQRGWT